MYDLVIKNGTVLGAGEPFVGDVAVQGEKIAALGSGLVGKREIAAEGLYVLPGGVDIHVHLEMPIPPFRTADDFYTGTRAAAFGGTTTIIDFVEAAPTESFAQAIAARKALAAARATIDYTFHMTLQPHDIRRLEQLSQVTAAGISSYKLYMAYGLRLTDDQLLLALTAVRNQGGWPVVHAENWDVIQALGAQAVARGDVSPHWHPRTRPALLEGEATGRVIDIAEYVGLPVHIFHVSCAEAALRIAEARRRGLPVTGETCPQYLLLTQDVYDREGVLGALPVCSPPIREQAQQDALWRGLADESLQLVTTDHAPFRAEDKATGLDDFRNIPGGVNGIEVRLAAVFQGVRRGLFSLERWVDLCCTTPARLAGLTQKGSLAVGKDADMVLFDPKAEWPLANETLHDNVGWTPYEGVTLTGKPVLTMRRGAIMVENGRFLANAGDGQFVWRGSKRSDLSNV